jgi:hypothetical protein
MTLTSKSTDSLKDEISLTDLDQVSGGDMTQKAILAAVAVTTVALGPVGGSLFLGCFIGALGVFA